MDLGKFNKTIGFDYNIDNKNYTKYNITNKTNPINNIHKYVDNYDSISNNDNKIIFWSDVTDESCKELISNIKLVETRLNDLKNNYNISDSNLPNIEIYINSPGGSVHDILAVVDYILTSKFKFTSIIEGCAASAATLLSVVCDTRKMHQNAMVLIHELSSGYYGKMSEMSDSIKCLNKIMDIIIKIYREHTNVSVNSLKEILKHDIYWSSEEAKTFCIIDEIIPVIKLPKFTRYNNRYTISQKDLNLCSLNLKRKQGECDNNTASIFNLLNSTENSTENIKENNDKNHDDIDNCDDKKNKKYNKSKKQKK